ncbi:MAG: FecR family protein [Synergistaceae bacterium]|jgi:hypothetical protein|nr:FecR family protein [Synergistaceae bacterium]
MKRLSLVAFVWLVAMAALFTGHAEAAAPVGRIESASGDAWAMREGRRAGLAVGSDLYEYDIINTGEGASVQAVFADGSVLQMGGGASVSVMEVVFSPGRSRFNLGITQGAARAITGEIAKINPNGFKITTPMSVIGIRGTTLSFMVSEAQERVTLEELSLGSTVRFTSRDTGKSWTMTRPGDSVTVTAPDVPGDAPVIDAAGQGVLEGDWSPGKIERHRAESIRNQRARRESGGRDRDGRAPNRPEKGDSPADKSDSDNDGGGGDNDGNGDNGGNDNGTDSDKAESRQSDAPGYTPSEKGLS